MNVFEALGTQERYRYAKFALIRRIIKASEYKYFEPLLQHSEEPSREALSGPYRSEGENNNYIDRLDSSAGTTLAKGLKNQDAAAKEYLVSQVGKAIDAPVGELRPRRSDSKNNYEMEMPLIHGMTGSNATYHPDGRSHEGYDMFKIPQHHLFSGARQLGLLDYLTNNNDRHIGNYMIPEGEDGHLKPEVRGIDHEQSFLYPNSPFGDMAESNSPFSSYWVGTPKSQYDGYLPQEMEKNRQHSFSKPELERHKTALEAIKPEFDKLQLPQYHEEMMERLNHLINTANPGAFDTLGQEPYPQD